jgi:hypothetical protein
MYLPYVVAVVVKFFVDIKNKAVLIGTNKLFYAFSIYYFIVSAYRIVSHGEVKESIYLFIVFLGSMAFLMLNTELKLNKDQTLIYSLLAISIIILIYRFSLLGLVPSLFSCPPINTNVLSCILLILIAFFAYYLSVVSDNKQWFIASILILSLVLVFVSGARASFFLLLLVIVISFIILFIYKKRVAILFGSCVLTSILIVIILFGVGFRDVRSSVSRELWIFNRFILTLDNEDTNHVSSSNQERIIEEQNQQISRSDIARKDLVEKGLQEIRKNPLFGTGNVYYEQRIRETYIANQTSHCFLIESMVSFGGVGTLLGFGLFFFIIFSRLKKSKSNVKLFIILTIVSHLLYCLVQPLFFEPIVSFVFTLIISSYSLEDKI